VPKTFLCLLSLPLCFLCSVPFLLAQAEQSHGLRLIVVSSEEKAAALRAQVLKGASFDALAREHSTDSSAKAGGYLGVFAPTDLRREFQAALAALKPGEVSPVIKIGNEFALLQPITEEEVSRGILSSRWAGKEGSGLTEMLDNFTALLSLAYFRDRQFEEMLKKYEQTVRQAPVSEDLYLAMNSILSGAELRVEAEALMSRAIQQFPESRRVRYRLAELHRDSGRMRKALEVFREASEMKAPADMDALLDRRQRSFIYQRMGGINTDLVQFDDAVAAYKKALEIDSTNAEARLALGDLYLRRDRLDDALTEYTRVAADRPESAAPHNRLSELYLRMGRLSDSEQSAARALANDPTHRRSSYVRAMALIRLGRDEEGEKQLQQYEKLESDAQLEANLDREISTTNRGAASLLLDGRGDEAIGMFRRGVELYPKALAVRLNLALAQAKLGRNQDAAKTFQEIIDLGSGDSFLIHFNLARLYERLGDTKAGRRHQLLYLQALDEALEAGLN
jgi:tetratricopeptide (TPR) repeat protein